MEERQEYYVYVHTNKINGKKYVGITRQTPEQRWQGGNGYYNNQYFYNAIKKYGWEEGFTHEIFYMQLTRKEACEKERELIKLYKSNDPEYGYNHSEGGDINYLDLDEYKIEWDFNLPPYSVIKNNRILKGIFDGLVKLAKGYSYKETTTKIWYENGIETKRKVIHETFFKEHRRDISDLIIKNYENEPELGLLIKELKQLKKENEW